MVRLPPCHTREGFRKRRLLVLSGRKAIQAGLGGSWVTGQSVTVRSGDRLLPGFKPRHFSLCVVVKLRSERNKNRSADLTGPSGEARV